MGIMLDSPTASFVDRTYSHARNSPRQITVADIVKEIIDETIEEKLDITTIHSGSNKFVLADMGCSVGPNTFYTVHDILEAVKRKFESKGLTSEQLPEFQVFFNDLAFNDFNTLFMSLPLDRDYFAAGVPGSFHGKLFPNSSLHFVFSSYALQWLSQVPSELLDKGSSAWNKGKIHYTNASKEVVKAYASQFAKDMGNFLEARAKEVVEGGMLLLILPSIPEEIPPSQVPIGVLFEVLGSCLVDMVKEGLVSEALVDPFNIPMYSVTPKELMELVEQNGCFSIERIESTACSHAHDQPTGHSVVMSLRGGMEGIFIKQFGCEIVDELFDRFEEKIEELMHLLMGSNHEGSQLAVFMKRRCLI